MHKLKGGQCFTTLDSPLPEHSLPFRRVQPSVHAHKRYTAVVKLTHPQWGISYPLYRCRNQDPKLQQPSQSHSQRCSCPSVLPRPEFTQHFTGC